MSFRCYTTEKVKTHVSKFNTDMCLIPGGLTTQLQPADVSWNKPFKTAYRELYNEWMASGRKHYTSAGNVKPPDKLLCLEWVKKSWERVTEEVVAASFKACSISNSEDGSEDSEIHCLKEGGVAHSAVEEVRAQLRRLYSGEERGANDSDDPFTDLEELEEDEAAIDSD